jgi:hypothetical protein
VCSRPKHILIHKAHTPVVELPIYSPNPANSTVYLLKAAGFLRVTSLWLFRDDVERLLRDLYGDVESDALDRVLGAVFAVVRNTSH